ncbi:hypothetical protein ACFT1A_28335 [Rhodococcus sp. NPDC057135]|uniref:hypothetical protein n=1 Tax=Rhodococcus sp. NPDC057135 TaxID=3346028 RepID=UPI003639FE53
MEMLDASSDPRAHEWIVRLGLSLDTVRDVLLFGDAEAATYTTYDANGAGEMARWSRHVRRMSELLVPQGWKRIDPLNQPTLVHPSGEHSIVVTSGTSLTGTAYGVPKTKNPKGRSIREAVRGNAELALMRPDEVDPDLSGLRETWILLTHADPNGRLQAELSLPSEMEGEQIGGWLRRILLPTISPSRIPEPKGDDGPASYEFSVARK